MEDMADSKRFVVLCQEMGSFLRLFHINTAVSRQRQEYLYQFQTSLVYIVNPGQPGLYSETLPLKNLKRNEEITQGKSYF